MTMRDEQQRDPSENQTARGGHETKSRKKPNQRTPRRG